MGKKKYKKAIKSYLKQIKIHLPKLEEAKNTGNIGFERYTLKEWKTFSKEVDKRKIKNLPRKARIKHKKQLKKSINN